MRFSFKPEGTLNSKVHISLHNDLRMQQDMCNLPKKPMRNPAQYAKRAAHRLHVHFASTDIDLKNVSAHTFAKVFLMSLNKIESSVREELSVRDSAFSLECGS